MPRSPSPPRLSRSSRRSSKSPSLRNRDDADNHRPRHRDRRSRSPSNSGSSPQRNSRPSRDNAQSSRDRSHNRPRRDNERNEDRRDHSRGGEQGARDFEWGGEESRKRDAATEGEGEDKEEDKVEKELPNFGLSGKLAAETNTFKGVVLKYSEPAEARKPSKRWRLYVFKGDQQTDLLHIHRQSAFLFGRDRVVADIPVDHPSCSKQHAVLQYRQVPETDKVTGQVRRVIKPFIIDLEATNGTLLNDQRIPASRYVELRPKDVLKFGHSTREYVLLHDDAAKD
ncbi:hypothetical protein BC937DRAFT_92287 [Endogone sp. FLAS-F59071]|nr:hypothetical protein BC937DRAFT_92287 [Endogone sp. FLAS-F59071]|eukprot:RUS21551.1 hypothetical protein BC937DRAFT_92287 [Endogone sp. FLAS-F59071]